MAIWRKWSKPKTESKYPARLTMHQLWMVSLSAPVSRDKDASRTTLYPFTRIDDAKAEAWLAEQWEITGPDKLIGRLGRLARFGYRAQFQRVLGFAPLAWDVGLYVDISRRGFACGMLSEADTWRLLKDIVPAVAGTYGSWKEYADHYLQGRQIWRNNLQGTRDQNFPAPQSASDAHIQSLLDPANTTSPWNLAPWETISNPDRAR
ncbi:DUF1266 domain-containing protein [Streptomyces sp. NPDC059037]|uniref:DUF1266 domain-containing protein n=1 Tax=Streptomyces sp. NPDC059037 TaxID=3346710 RepID=UPI00369CFB10